MSADFAVVRENLGLGALAKFLLEHRVTCAAVSNEHGTLVGYVSMIDLVRDRYLNGETESYSPERKRRERMFNGTIGSGYHLETTPRTTVADIMMPFVLRLPNTASIDQAAALMASEGVHRVLIVSESDEVVGIVSALDVLRWLCARDGYAVPDSARALWRDSCEYATG